jgi:hypothetical protein
MSPGEGDSPRPPPATRGFWQWLGRGHRLSPEELGLLAKQPARAKDPADAALLRERLTRGFYGT